METRFKKGSGVFAGTARWVLRTKTPDPFLNRRPDKRPPRDGMALVLVLGVVTFALAIAYVAMRTQSTASRVQQNAGRQALARQAANAGISAALRAMHSNSWQGVDTTLTGQLNADDTYEVKFVTGDPSLTASDPDWHDYPYRVTLRSTGYARDPANPTVRAVHRTRAVVQLVPRKLSPPPASWASLQNYTIDQWANRAVDIEMPFRAEGPVMLQGPLSMFSDYPYVSKPFDGDIDEVAVFNRALTAAEIGAIYATMVAGEALTSYPGLDDLTEFPPTVADWYELLDPISWWRLNEAAGATVAADEQNANHGTYAGAVAGVTGAPIGGMNSAARFDGLNDYVDVGKFNISGSAMTILAWFKVNSFGYDDGRIISKATSPDENDHYWMLSTIKQTDKYRLRCRLKTGGNTTTLIASLGDVPTGQWVFAAMTYDGALMTLYKDGEPVGLTAKTGSIATNSSVPVYIGDNPPGSTRARYLRDLERRRVETAVDHRTFSGPIDMPFSRSSDDARSLLADDLKVTLNNVAASDTAPLTYPGNSVTSYRLYPGGKLYDAVEVMGISLAGQTLEPDMTANPLGIFYRDGALTLNNNTNIQGTLVVSGWTSLADLYFSGTNVNLSAAYVPPLDGSSQTLELPVAIVKDDIRALHGTDATVRGFVTAGDEFELQAGDDSMRVDMEGRLVTGELLVRERWNWDESQSWWRERANEFLAQLGAAGAISYFPDWLEQQQDLPVEPKLQIKPPSQPVSYHWHDWNSPLFVPGDGDAGLRWDLIEWTTDF